MELFLIFKRLSLLCIQHGDSRVNVLTDAGGYSIMVKGFGNAVEVKPFDKGSGFYPEPAEG